MRRYSLLLPILLLMLNTAQSNQETSIKPSITQTAIFAGGCFWCVESDFDKVPGVSETLSGYIGGHLDNPTYDQVVAGDTGHTEAVRITFDAQQISYEKLLNIFWRSIDPTTKNRQFCDAGEQYRSGIFYTSPDQKKIAEQSKSGLDNNKPFTEPVVTEITQATKFYPAEEYHQNYYKKNPLRYKYYRYSCGRDKRISELWK